MIWYMNIVHLKSKHMALPFPLHLPVSWEIKIAIKPKVNPCKCYAMPCNTVQVLNATLKYKKPYAQSARRGMYIYSTAEEGYSKHFKTSNRIGEEKKQNYDTPTDIGPDSPMARSRCRPAKCSLPQFHVRLPKCMSSNPFSVQKLWSSLNRAVICYLAGSLRLENCPLFFW